MRKEALLATPLATRTKGPPAWSSPKINAEKLPLIRELSTGIPYAALNPGKKKPLRKP
jgi:hypothetical protein